MRLPTDPFLVRYLERAFRWLNAYGSPFEFVLAKGLARGPEVYKTRVAALTECWVLLNFSLAWVAILIARPLIDFGRLPSWGRSTVWFAFLFYPALRIVEVVVFQIWTQILGGYRNKPPRMVYTVVSLRRSVVLAGILYIEAIVWFGVMYEVLYQHFTEDVVRHWYGALYYSAVTMTTTGFGDITPITPATYVLSTVQVLVGWAMIVLIVSRVVAYLPRPSSLDPVDEAEVSLTTASNGPVPPAAQPDR